MNPVILQPRVFAQYVSAGSLRRIFVEALDKEILQQLRASFGNRGHVVFDDLVHD